MLDEQLYCECCNSEFHLMSEDQIEVRFCPFCGEALDDIE